MIIDIEGWPCLECKEVLGSMYWFMYHVRKNHTKSDKP